MKQWALVLGMLMLGLGCQANPPSQVVETPASPALATPTPVASVDQGGHHEHTAPHGGTLITLGDHVAHLELVWQVGEGQLTVYLLDGEAEKPLRSPQEALELKAEGKTYRLAAVANALTGETVGDSSQFQGELEGLKGKSEWKAELEEVQLLGTPHRSVELDFPHGNH